MQSANESAAICMQRNVVARIWRLRVPSASTGWMHFQSNVSENRATMKNSCGWRLRRSSLMGHLPLTVTTLPMEARERDGYALLKRGLELLPVPWSRIATKLAHLGTKARKLDPCRTIFGRNFPTPVRGRGSQHGTRGWRTVKRLKGKCANLLPRVLIGTMCSPWNSMASCMNPCGQLAEAQG